jgi:hypothetical protein
MIGPLLQPSESSNPVFPPLEEAPPEDSSAPIPLPPGSPHTAMRALIHDLTLPAVPNMDIPPSPPGSPPPGTTKKFEQFLELKQKGVHFNSKLMQSSALKNPSLMDKLLAFVELGSPGDQYATTLPADSWDPGAFPREAYKEQLRQKQSEIAQARARGKGAPVDFVSSSGGGGGGGGGGDNSGADAAPDGGGAMGKRKTRFDN